MNTDKIPEAAARQMLYFIIPFEAAALDADDFAVLIFEP